MDQRKPLTIGETVAVPTFDTIPAIQNRSGMRFGTVTVSGVSTRHDAEDTDNGRLYGVVNRNPDSSIGVVLFSDYEKTKPFLVGAGSSNAFKQSLTTGFASQTISVELAPGRTGVTATGKATIIQPNINPRAITLDDVTPPPRTVDLVAWAVLNSQAGPTGATPTGTNAILIVSLSLDADVFTDEQRASNMPGYDPVYGLAAFHARAAKRIILNDLASALPFIFQAKSVSPFVPLAPDVELPDLTRIESVESLRDASATLVRAFSAEEAEYTAEFAAMAAGSRKRYAEIMAEIRNANAPQSVAVEESTTKGIQIATWRRG